MLVFDGRSTFFQFLFVRTSGYVIHARYAPSYLCKVAQQMDGDRQDQGKYPWWMSFSPP